MPASDDERLSDIEARLQREDPRFARALGAGRPRSPREYPRLRAWLLFVLALVVLGGGIALAHGLLIAAGLVLAGLAGEMFGPGRDPRRDGGRRRPRF
ncbi:hypothetical protein GCM10009535_28550 [Streptomyces thermocarboxydovorans]|uniref:DUF3040 domain-containing protein n=1 Tax=Streptomyces thermocarboxydovorans TaxID=59298 RepID=A0ABP3SLC1_9ACTN